MPSWSNISDRDIDFVRFRAPPQLANLCWSSPCLSEVLRHEHGQTRVVVGDEEMLLQSNQRKRRTRFAEAGNCRRTRMKPLPLQVLLPEQGFKLHLEGQGFGAISGNPDCCRHKEGRRETWVGHAIFSKFTIMGCRHL